MDSPGKNTGVGCHFFLQGIFPTQGSSLHIPHWRQILYHLSHQGSPKANLAASLIYCPKPKFCSGSSLTEHPRPRFLCPVNFSQIYCFFAKKRKSCLLFLGPVFMRPLPSQIKFVFIIPTHLSWVHFIISPAIAIQGDLRGEFPPLRNKQVLKPILVSF